MLQDWVFLLVLLPFLWIAAYTDLHSMLLKNWMTATVALLFLPLGLALLPLDAYFYRLGITVGVGVVLVAMGLLRAFGMGDAKYVTALTPYVAPEDYVSVLLVLSFTNLFALGLLAAASRMASVRALAPHWKSWEARHLPMGLSISATALFYFTARALGGWDALI